MQRVRNKVGPCEGLYGWLELEIWGSTGSMRQKTLEKLKKKKSIHVQFSSKRGVVVCV